MNVRIKRLHPDAVIPQYAKPGDSGFDLVAVEDVVISPGETQLVPTGLAFEIPEGYELLVRPRSGLSYKTKLRVANPPGTIDAGFRGEVKVIIDNIAQPRYSIVLDGEILLCNQYGDVYDVNNEDAMFEYGMEIHGSYLIRKGDRIAQGVIAPVIRATFEETDGDLTETERGSGGFGHTGTSTEVAAE